jgi:hypothetical protein
LDERAKNEAISRRFKRGTAGVAASFLWPMRIVAQAVENTVVARFFERAVGPACRFRYHPRMADVPPPEPPPTDETRKPRPATFGQVLRAVLWSFFGVRRGDAMRRDMVSIRPHQVIIVGILIAAAFVATLLIIVRIVTRNV